MRRPTKLMLHISKRIKPESCARMRKRIRNDIRAYNNSSVFFTWVYQASEKL